MMRILKFVIAFDGSGYCGWQRQQNGPSIQQEIERAVSLICAEPTTVHGAGRTDAGVHALGMTAHIRTPSRVSCAALQKGLNSLLPDAIRILSVDLQTDDFHARFSAVGKSYRYSVYTGNVLCPTKRLYTSHLPYRLSRSAIRACLEKITGTHDFSSFETAGSRDRSLAEGRGAVRTIFQANLSEPFPDTLHLMFTGDGFLRHMVRNLSGTILEVARGKRTIDELDEILAAHDRNRAGVTAPPQGLTLMKVHYDRDWQ